MIQGCFTTRTVSEWNAKKKFIVETRNAYYLPERAFRNIPEINYIPFELFIDKNRR